MSGGTTLQLSSQQVWSQRALNLLFCASGIIFCYGAFSVFQEKMWVFCKIKMEGKQFSTQKLFGEKKERFVYMQALVFFQCATNLFVAWFVLRKTKKSMDNVPNRLYSLCSTSYFLAMLFSSYALEWVNYPTQVLGKSCKPIPIMLFGVLFAHKRYGLRKYFYVLLIVMGMAIFLYKPHKGSIGFQFGSGELFLCLSLVMDGVTGAVQDRIRHYHHTDKWTMMFSMNAFSSVFLAVMLLVSGELFQFFRFVAAYPFILQQIFLFAISGAIGQCFIFKTVTDFGPLTCSIITTLRKLFSLVFSIIIFSHPYTNRHAIGITFVFVALILDAIDSRKNHGKENRKDVPQEKNGFIQVSTAPEKDS